MPQLIITSRAASGLRNCRNFLAKHAPSTAGKAARMIQHYFALLKKNPEMGRPLASYPDVRELVMGFGISGYVALYQYDASAGSLYILAFRHQRQEVF